MRAKLDGDLSPSRVTSKAACEERLRYLRDDKQRKRSTMAAYSNVIDHDRLPYFGEDTPVEDINTHDVDALKDHLLTRVSHRTAQEILVILHGVMARAKRKAGSRSTLARTRRRSPSSARTTSTC